MRARGKCIEFPSANLNVGIKNTSRYSHRYTDTHLIHIAALIWNHQARLALSCPTFSFGFLLSYQFSSFVYSNNLLQCVVENVTSSSFFVFPFFTENPLFSRVWVTELSPTKYFVVFRFLRALTDSLLIAIHLHSNSLWTALTFAALGFNFLFNFCVELCAII